MEKRILKKDDVDRCIKIIRETLGKKDALEAKEGLFIGLDEKRWKRRCTYLQRWVLLEKKKVIGITGLYSRLKWPRDCCAIGWFAIDKKFHGKGLGKTALKITMKLAKNKKFKKICVWSTKEALPFYEKNGFNLAKKILTPKEGYRFLEKKLF